MFEHKMKVYMWAVIATIEFFYPINEAVLTKKHNTGSNFSSGIKREVNQKLRTSGFHCQCYMLVLC